MNFVLRDLDLHFQGQTFSCYAFAIQSAQAADVRGRFASTRTAQAVESLLLQVVHKTIGKRNLHLDMHNRIKGTHICVKYCSGIS